MGSSDIPLVSLDKRPDQSDVVGGGEGRGGEGTPISVHDENNSRQLVLGIFIVLIYGLLTISMGCKP